MPSLQTIRPGPDPNQKTVLFNPDSISSVESFSSAERRALSECFDREELSSEEIQLGIDNFRVPELLDAVLGQERAIGSYSFIGHIVHLNLREHHEDFKEVVRQGFCIKCFIVTKLFLTQVIGRILLRISRITLVVNKTSAIDTEFRFFSMEVLAREGDKREDEFVASTKENGCDFELDFSRVYWNPRLCTEHSRVVDLIGDGDVVFDVFAGVGPFAVPAAKRKKCSRVLANDLNPESYK